MLDIVKITHLERWVPF